MPEAQPQQQFQGSNGQELQKLDVQFDRIEASFEAIASQYDQAHHRLLAIHKIAPFFGLPPSLFKRCFELWLQSRSEGGESK
jgi:hypothetical protein